MAKREISPRQKNYIIENYQEKSAEELAKHLGVTAREVQKIIDDYRNEGKKQEEVPFILSNQMPHMNKSVVYLLYVIGFIAIFLFGFYYRMYPVIKHEKLLLDYDYAFHLRMTESILETGMVPKIDTFSWYPEGKPVRELLPVILYYLGAGFYLFEKLFTNTSLQDSVMLFYGFFCALTMIPVFFILRLITGKNHIGFIGAALCSFMPANLTRTFCTRYRYEGPGVLFLLINMFFFIKALETKDNRKFYLYSILSSFFMILAIGTWRVGLLFPTLYGFVFIILIFLRRVDARVAGAFFIQVIGVIFSAIWFTFLSSQNYIFSHNAMLTAGLGITALCTQWWKKEGVIKVNPMLLIIPVVLMVVVPMSHLATGYESFFKVLLLKIRFSFQQFQITGIENILFMNTAELSSVPPADFFKWDMCSWAANFIVLYPVALFFFRKKKERLSVEELIIAVFFFTIFFLTMVFYRNKVLLSPFVAIAGAIAVDRLAEYIKRARLARQGLPVLYAMVIVITLGTAWRTGVYVSHVRLELRPFLQDALVNLDKINKNRLPVICYWSYGYVVQTYAKSPTFLDGLLESPIVHKRLVEMSNLLLQDDEEKFYQFCKKYGMGVYFVDKWNSRTQLYALYAEKNYFDYFTSEGRPTPLGANTVRARMVFAPNTLSKFRLVYANQRFSIFMIS